MNLHPYFPDPPLLIPSRPARARFGIDTQGNAYLTTSYADTAGTTIVNQVEDVYNGLGQLTGEYQSHSGAVNTSTTPEVQYSYSLMSGGANNSRLTSITYPNGYVLDYNYNSGVDSNISRLSSLSDSTGTLQTYSYLGLDTPVIVDDPQADIELTYVEQAGDPYANTDGGDQYTGLDRFGRVIDQYWLNTSTDTATDRFQYGYDQDGNVLYKNNLVNTSFSELYHANGSSNGYDDLNQLVAFSRGTLNSTNDTISSPSASETWTTDAAGNFTSAAGTSETNNLQNEATGFGSATLTYDANGNLTTDQAGNTLVYDAWNRLVAYKNGSTTLETLSYDGLDRLIVQNPGTATDLYYSDQWQVLEERQGSAVTAHYVWSPLYVDGLVLRDRSTGGGTLNERLWVQQDANWNVTALVNGSGSVVERYVYDPYGVTTVLTASWGSTSGSAYAWIYGHQGGRLDTTTGLYNFRERDESPVLGRWIEIDPTGFAGGDVNVFRYEDASSEASVDPTGLRDYRPQIHAFIDVVTFPLFYGLNTASTAIVGKPPAAVGINLGGKLGFAGPLGGFNGGGLGLQILYFPNSHKVAVYPYVALPMFALAMPGFGALKPGGLAALLGKPSAGFGLTGAIDLSGVLAYNVKDPKEYGGTFLQLEGSALAPTEIGGLGGHAGVMAPPMLPPNFNTGVWAVYAGPSWGIPGLGFAPGVSYSWPLVADADDLLNRLVNGTSQAVLATERLAANGLPSLNPIRPINPMPPPPGGLVRQ